MFSTHHREFYFASAEGKPACYKIRVMNLSFEETEHRKADRTVGVNCFVFPIFRQARPDFFRECLQPRKDVTI